MDYPDFSPNGVWRNGHTQSLLSSLKLRRSTVAGRARDLLQHSIEELIECDDGVRLSCMRSAQANPEAPVAILIHGWEGSADSLYMLSAGAHLYRAGFEVCRLQLRDHGQTHGLNQGIFHSCRIKEVVDAVAVMQQKLPGRAFCLAGFSLGGNFALRIGARAKQAGLELNRIVAICPVLHPAATLDALEHEFWPYNYYFMRKWRRSLKTKHRHWPNDYDIDAMNQQKSMRDLTEHLVTRYSDFGDLETYLNGYAITGEALATLTTPSLLVAAHDDPIIPIHDLDRIYSAEALTVRPTQFGGHCGYLYDLKNPSWADGLLLHEFSGAVGMQQKPLTDVASNAA